MKYNGRNFEVNDVVWILVFVILKIFEKRKILNSINIKLLGYNLFKKSYAFKLIKFYK